MAAEKDKATVDLETMRHSASHVMAEAVQSVFPEAKFAIGPSIENGFYYDFGLPRALTMDDLPAIEARMKEIIKADSPFTRQEVTKDEARKLFRETEANMPPLPADEQKPWGNLHVFNHELMICWLAYKEAKSML